MSSKIQAPSGVIGRYEINTDKKLIDINSDAFAVFAVVRWDIVVGNVTIASRYLLEDRSERRSADRSAVGGWLMGFAAVLARRIGACTAAA